MSLLEANSLVINNSLGEEVDVFVRTNGASADLYIQTSTVPRSIYDPTNPSSCANHINFANYQCGKVDVKTAVFPALVNGESITLMVKNGDMVLSGVVWYAPTRLGYAKTDDPSTIWKLSGGPERGFTTLEFGFDLGKVWTNVSNVEGFSCYAKLEYGPTVPRALLTDTSAEMSNPSSTATTIPATFTNLISMIDSTTYKNLPTSIDPVKVILSDKYTIPDELPDSGFPYRSYMLPGGKLEGMTKRNLIAAGTGKDDGIFQPKNPLHQHVSRLFTANLISKQSGTADYNSFASWLRTQNVKSYSWAYDEIEADGHPLSENDDWLGYGTPSKYDAPVAALTNISFPNPLLNSDEFDFLNQTLPGLSSYYSVGLQPMANLESGKTGFSNIVFGGSANDATPTNSWWFETVDPYIVSDNWAKNTGVLHSPARVLNGVLEVTFINAPWLTGNVVALPPSHDPITTPVFNNTPTTTRFTGISPSSQRAGHSVIVYGDVLPTNSDLEQVYIDVDGVEYYDIRAESIDASSFRIHLPGPGNFAYTVEGCLMAPWAPVETHIPIKIVMPAPEISQFTTLQITPGKRFQINGAYFPPDATITLYSSVFDETFTIANSFHSADGHSLGFIALKTATTSGPDAFNENDLPREYMVTVSGTGGTSNEVLANVVCDVEVKTVPAVPVVTPAPRIIESTTVTSKPQPEWLRYVWIGGTSLAVVMFVVAFALFFRSYGQTIIYADGTVRQN